jgi:probable F420-dependent oxidoreductase
MMSASCRVGDSVQRSFRFAVQAFDAGSAKEWAETARRAEDLGFSTLHLADHLLGPGPALAGSNHPPQSLAAVPAMAYAAAITSTLRIGCRVFCVDYRLPAVLAKEAATIDLLSDGRLELGLGAGWWAGEYEAVGAVFEAPGKRITRLEEQVKALKAYFGGEQLDIRTPNVTMAGFSGTPPVVQAPHPPILIGGGGKRVLGLAGRFADIVSINVNNSSGNVGAEAAKSSSAEQLPTQLDWIRAGAPHRFDQLELELGLYYVAITDSPERHWERLQRIYGLTREEALEYPHALVGSAAAAADQLRERRERYGISYYTVFGWSAQAFAPVVAELAGS